MSHGDTCTCICTTEEDSHIIEYDKINNANV